MFWGLFSFVLEDGSAPKCNFEIKGTIVVLLQHMTLLSVFHFDEHR